MKFKPKMIEALPYEIIEYLDSKPNSFLKINDEQYELLNTADENDKKIYNYFFVKKNENDEKIIFNVIKEAKKGYNTQKNI